jgi:hypothetical protein
MSNQENLGSSLVISYLALRKAIGILGILLPFVLFLGASIFFDTGLQGSISGYYYTGMRDVLVGTLFTFGVFLFSYKGYERADDIAGYFACVFALGVALFPTTPSVQPSDTEKVVGILHLVFTVAFFVSLIYFSLVLFVKSSQEKPYPKKKRQRNLVYQICGWAMVVCMLAMVIDFFLPSATAWLGEKSVFWLETVAILAFGISWFTKGEAIALLND